MLSGLTEDWIGTILGTFIRLVFTWAVVSALLAAAAYVVIAGLGVTFGFGGPPSFWMLLGFSGALAGVTMGVR